MHPPNSGSTVRIVLQCRTIKGAKRDMEIILMVFLKEKLIWDNLVILAQKLCILITLDLLQVFFKILHNERGWEVHKSFISCFSRKNFIWGNLIFLGLFLLFDWAWSKLIQVTVTIASLNGQGMISFMITTGSLNSQGIISFTITTGSLNSQDMIRILKHDFSGKRLCDGYFMDIMWCLCMEVNIQQRVEWFCEKASLRICCVILFDCKGP